MVQVGLTCPNCGKTNVFMIWMEEVNYDERDGTRQWGVEWEKQLGCDCYEVDEDLFERIYYD